MILLKILLYIMHCWLLFLITSVIYSKSLKLPNYDDLKIHSGTINYVGYITGSKNSFIPITVNINEKHEQFRMPVSVKHDLNKNKVGDYIKIGTWDVPSLFFFKETEVWHIELNNKVIYRHGERYKRVKSNRPIFVSIEIIFLIVYAYFIKKTWSL